jgi:hypothetical protein
MLIMLQASAHAPEDTASDSKSQRLNEDDIMELILEPDSDGDISNRDQCV